MESIRRDGLIHPITLHADGRILDGKERYRACLEAGIRPRFETCSKDDGPYAYVWSMNALRMHLTDGQRAACAVEYMKYVEVERLNEATQRCFAASALTRQEAVQR